MADFSWADRQVLKPGDLLVIRVRSDATRPDVQAMLDAIRADGRLEGRVIILPAEQLVIVRKDETVTDETVTHLA